MLHFELLFDIIQKTLCYYQHNFEHPVAGSQPVRCSQLRQNPGCRDRKDNEGYEINTSFTTEPQHGDPSGQVRGMLLDPQ